MLPKSQKGELSKGDQIGDLKVTGLSDVDVKLSRRLYTFRVI